jgi:hypothetical protein
MSFKIHFASLSLGASVDQQTGSLSVFEVIDEIRVPQLPIQLSQMVISVQMEKLVQGAVSGKVMIHAITPDGQQALVGDGGLSVPTEQRRMKAVFRFGGFPLQAWGRHRFVLSFMGPSGAKEAEAILDFDVVQVTQVAQGAEPGAKPGLQH